jgi:hypothetical protein
MLNAPHMPPPVSFHHILTLIFVRSCQASESEARRQSPLRITLRDLVRTRVREEVVLFGGGQVTDLNDELHLTADSDIRFIRLVQLVGG